jgi:heme exporter protein C
MREKLVYVFAVLGALLLAWNLYGMFMVLPDEAAQGPIYRIMFFHVPAAITAFLGFFTALVLSGLFLKTNDLKYDALAASVTEVSFMFACVNVATGSIWGRIIWGIWWAWDARMTTQLMLFLLYLGYLLMRPAITEPTQRGVMSAILAIFAAADIPIVIMAIRLHNLRTQHPAPVLETGGLAPIYQAPFWLGVLSFMLLGSAIMLVRLHQESNSREIDSLRREVHAF